MADKTISETTLVTTPVPAYQVPFLDPSEADDGDKNKRMTFADLVIGSIIATDGAGLNYKLAASAAAGVCYIAVTPANDAAYSATNYSTFNVNGVILKLAAAPTALGFANVDYFLWDAHGVTGNDAQLFIYAIDNDGVLSIGGSASPNLTVVAANYRLNDGTQVGAAKFSNMCVNSATMVSGSPCRVIGRVNVKQHTDNTWLSPTAAKVVSTPVFETDVMGLTFTTNANPTPSAITLKYAIKKDRCIVFGDSENVSVTGAGAVMKIYLPALPTMTKVKAPMSLYDTAWKLALAYVVVDSGHGQIHLTKSDAGAGWAGNETGVYINFVAEYPINE